jgi:aminotransferase EvaB
MQIRNWTYQFEYEELSSEILKAIQGVFLSGKLILGDRVREFEEKFAAYSEAAHGVGVNSGTDAIFLGLKALGVGPGDEVVTVANTAVPTVAAIRATGATPVFVDIDPETYLMRVDRVKERITPRTRVLLPVHLFGQAVDMDPLLALAREHQLKILEDCAQSHGCRYKGRMTGSMGDVGAFSFYPTKVLGAYGDGGLCVTQSPELAERLRMLRFYGMKSESHSEIEGFNSRLDEVQAAILLVKLRTLSRALEARRHIARLYQRELQGSPFRLPITREFSTHSYYLYVVRCKGRDEVIRRMKDLGIEVRIHGPTPIHLMRGYAFLKYKAGDLPETEGAAGEIMSLPLYPGMADEQVLRVAGALKETVG